MRTKTLKSGILLLAFSFIAQISFAQCPSWMGLPRQSDAEDAHTIYRQAIKTNDWDIAFDNWKIAYEIAPAADGKRDYHFTDGAKIYVEKYYKHRAFLSSLKLNGRLGSGIAEMHRFELC